MGHGLTPNLAGIKVLEKDTLRGCDVAAVQLGERRRQENDSVSVSAQLDEGAAAHVERGEAAVGGLVAVEQALDSVKRLDWVVLGDELLQAAEGAEKVLLKFTVGAVLETSVTKIHCGSGA